MIPAKEDHLEIATDFRGNYFITKIFEDDNPKTCNYELFKEEYFNFDYQEIIYDLPDLEPGKRYEIRYRTDVAWDYEHVDCDVEIHYVKGSLKEIK